MDYLSYELGFRKSLWFFEDFRHCLSIHVRIHAQLRLLWPLICQQLRTKIWFRIRPHWSSGFSECFKFGQKTFGTHCFCNTVLLDQRRLAKWVWAKNFKAKFTIKVTFGPILFSNCFSCLIFLRANNFLWPKSRFIGIFGPNGYGPNISGLKVQCLKIYWPK